MPAERNGYRNRRWDTRAVTIQLAIPKRRQGSYSPDWLLDHRKRGERALVAVVAESYLRGVSTRKVDDLVRAMGIDGISKSQVSELARRTRWWRLSGADRSTPRHTRMCGSTPFR